MLEQLKEQVCAANKMLPQYGLVSFTWGNVSGIDRDSGLAGHGPFVWAQVRCRPFITLRSLSRSPL